MPYFKDPNNNLHVLDDETFAHVLPPGCVKLTDVEAITMITPSVAQKEQEALSAVSGWCDYQGSLLSSGYPETEVKSWFKQEAEARAWLVNNLEPTPLLSAMANARGITITDMVQRVIVKADAFAGAAGTIIGMKQAKEDQITSIVTDAILTDDEKRAALQTIINTLNGVGSPIGSPII